MNKPLVFNIQKFSPHDGDGIRTTIFFKGCPLRCRWCHNPESQNYHRELIYYHQKCTACGRCIPKCPSRLNQLIDGKLSFSHAACTACGSCEDACLTEAREIAGRQYEIKELVKEARKDLMFYEQSGGGVTLSGGEVMTMDMDYIEKLVRALHAEGISVFIDTSGCAPYEHFQRILPYVDVFLYDIKAMDPEIHKKYTGQDNRLILENLIRLSNDGAGIYLRIPTIEGVNATDHFMNDIISFIKENNLRIRKVFLLPYHDIGKGKYENLDRTYDEESFSVPEDDKMQHFKQIFEQQGFSSQIGG